MAYAMTKQGSLDNCVTYEFICDTVADMNAIENRYRSIGSVAIVLQGESEGLEVYIAGSDKNWNSLSSAGASADSSATGGLSIYICGQAEVDSQTGLPDIDDPDDKTIYLVPAGETSGNLYEEYIYVDDAWEKFGSGNSGSIDLSNYIQNTDIATQSTAGLVKVLDNGNVTFNENNQLVLTLAGTAVVKSGQSDHPISVTHQHEAAFYGLAKAAGEDMKNSDNAVGTYTTEAASAIRTMIGAGTYSKPAGGIPANDLAAGVIPDTSIYAPKASPVFTGTVSLDRVANSTVGEKSVALGRQVTASGDYSFAEGNYTTASGSGAHAEGQSTVASAYNAHAEGLQTKARGNYSHAEGKWDTSSETTTYNNTTYYYGASGVASHSEGINTIAHGDGSHAEGESARAIGANSHAEGLDTKTTAVNSHAEGRATLASGLMSHAEGYGATASGHYAHAEGNDTIASGQTSHAEGQDSLASGSTAHAEGGATQATGTASHAEGAQTRATANYSHAEGGGSIASGHISHAEGMQTIAAGKYEHTSGAYNVADTAPAWVASTSYQVGDLVLYDEKIYKCKTANSDSTFSTSKWYTSGQYLVVVGNGTDSNARSNAYALDWDGNEYLKGDLYVGCNANSTGGTKVATTAQLSDYAPIANPAFTGSISMGRQAGSTIGNQSTAIGIGVTASGYDSYGEGYQTAATGPYSHAEGHNTLAAGPSAHAEGEGNGTSTYNYRVYTNANPNEYLNERTSTALTLTPGAIGSISHAEGYYTVASASYSHAEGYQTVAQGGGSEHVEGYQTYAAGYCGEHAEGMYTYATGGGGGHAEGKYTMVSGAGGEHAEGQYTYAAGMGAAHAEGYGTYANGQGAHAEGMQTQATQSYAHSEGYNVIASAQAAHGEGYNTVAEGGYSHSEGLDTIARGGVSHAEGSGTIALASCSHAGGKYNIADTYIDWPEWSSNTSYEIGDKVKITTSTDVIGYICKTANSDESFMTSKWNQAIYRNYAEIIGNGTAANARSNARALDWSGNERLMGDIYIGCNPDSTGGTALGALVSGYESRISALEAEITSLRVALLALQTETEVTLENGQPLSDEQGNLIEYDTPTT